MNTSSKRQVYPRSHAQGRHAVVPGRTEITVETERWTIVNKHRRTAWCPDCSREVEMLSIDDAAIFARVNSRTIFQRAESGLVHSSETSEGLLLICPYSPNLHP